MESVGYDNQAVKPFRTACPFKAGHFLPRQNFDLKQTAANQPNQLLNLHLSLLITAAQTRSTLLHSHREKKRRRRSSAEAGSWSSPCTKLSQTCFDKVLQRYRESASLLVKSDFMQNICRRVIDISCFSCPQCVERGLQDVNRK